MPILMPCNVKAAQPCDRQVTYLDRLVCTEGEHVVEPLIQGDVSHRGGVTGQLANAPGRVALQSWHSMQAHRVSTLLLQCDIGQPA
jgi:hypothetical protein